MSDSDDRSPLSVYRAKRSGDRTGEPLGGAVPPPAERADDAARLFVVQMHAARRLHWDLRLEIDGVLRSWAVPRGPSFDPAVKRLAVMTEDHPMEYVDFEGVIPDGNYGAGAMIVWDRGVWVAKEPIAEGFKKGKLLFELRGHKLRGVWTLVRTKGTGGHGHSHGMAQAHGKSQGGKPGADGEGDGNEWLLIKKPDSAADANAQAPGVEDRSILSGLTVEELRRGSDRGTVLRAKLVELGAPRRPIDPMKLELMLAETVEEPFSREGWVFELKYDGYRMIAARVDAGPGIDAAAPPRVGSVRGALLRYRSGLVCTHAFPEIARAIAALPFQGVVLDGEVVVLDDDARPNFQRLQRRGMLLKQHDVAQAMREHPVVYYAFDLLAFEGFDVRPLPLLPRKALLQQLLPPAGVLRFADHIPVRGQALFEQVRKMGLEGMLGKRADAPYQGRRSSDWARVRVEKTDDFVIVGFTEPEGSRTGLGSLHLGAYRGQALVYCGRVGTGLTGAQLLELRARLEPLIIDQPPCKITVASGRTDEWVEPLLCCEVRFRHRTEDDLLRLPVFVRMRDDKQPRECRLPDDPGSAEDLHDVPGGDEPPAAETRAIEGEIGVDDGLRRTAATPSPAAEGAPPADDPWAPPPPSTRVVISNPDKVFWPESGYTKQDLVDYYREISPFLLPYLRDRPLVLTRYPDGIDGKWFFQKNAPPFVPEWIKTQTMWSEHESREVEYFVVNDLDSLTFVANLATIPLHVWGSRLADLPHPDWCILDLDPKGAPFEHVVRIALAIHALCDEVGLPNYCKTSGSTGLHILVPLGGQCTFEQCRQLAQILGRLVASQLRDIATAERSKRAREGKVYIDYVQNGHGRLLVSAFSVRPRPRAPVSTPLHWDEVVPTLDHQALTIKNVPARMRALGRDPLLPVMTERPDLAAVLGKLAARLGS